MKKQDSSLLIKIDNDLKNMFKIKCDEKHLKMSTRIKYLMKMDSEDRILIK